MRKAFWSLALLSAYIWIVTTGNEQWVFDQGKRFYRIISAWFSDAEVDFQIQQQHQSSSEGKKKRPRRWD